MQRVNIEELEFDSITLISLVIIAINAHMLFLTSIYYIGSITYNKIDMVISFIISMVCSFIYVKFLMNCDRSDNNISVKDNICIEDE